MLEDQSIKIIKSYLFLGLFQVVHSVEETYTELYSYFHSMSETLHQYFPWVPIFAISADLFAIANYLMIALMLGSVPNMQKTGQWSFYLMWSWAVIELLNGVFHISTWIFLHHYFPGGVSGPMFLVLSILFIQKLLKSSTTNKEVVEVTQ